MYASVNRLNVLSELKYKMLSSGKEKTLSKTSPGFSLSATSSRSFENTVGKGEIGSNEQFLLFTHCFLDLPFWGTFCHFHRM